MKNMIVFICILGTLPALAGDWITWGGDGHRNRISKTAKNMPDSWDPNTGKNVKWSVDLGSQTYGNPVIAGGKIFVGTNNEGLRDPNVKGDKGNIMVFNEADGKFLWQAIHDKLSAGRVNDWPLQGICSSPYVDGNYVYYVNNRCELVCADVEGFYNGNQGFQGEKYNGKEHADIIWKYDMMEELGAFPHNLATTSPLIEGDLIFLLTGNGVDEGHLNLPSPRSPDFIAIHKKTGELVWEFGDTETILHGQWSSPAYGVIKGVAQAIFPGGDGWVYSLEPQNR